MKINKIKINSYGKLKNKEINLKNNINIIYGKNESGKSTLLKFILNIFYGTSKNKKGRDISDFEKYKPWDSEEFSGKLSYELDNKNKYEIYREFNKKNPTIFNEKGEDITKEFNIDKNKGSEFFHEQTQINEEMFLATSIAMQQEVKIGKDAQSTLIQRLSNLLGTGEDNVSYKKAIEKLNKKQLDEIGTERSREKPINILEKNIEKNKNEINELKKYENILYEIEEEKNKIKNNIEKNKIKNNLLKEIKKIKEKNNLEEEKIKINNNLKEEERVKINNLEKKLNGNKIKKENKNLINLIIFTLLFILNIILFIFKINKIINIILFAITLIFGVFTVLKIIKNNNKIKEKNKEQKRYLTEIEIIQNNINKIQKNIDKKNEENIQKNKIEKNKIKNTYKNEIDENEINYLLEENINEINNILENLNNEISSLKLQLHTNEIDYNNIIKKSEEKAKLEEQLEGSLEEKEEILKLANSINIAKTALENAYNKMKEEITPKFTKNLSNIVGKISSKKYNKIRFIDGQGLIVELDNGEYINANKLSIGTIDQLYLSLRLSAMQEITQEKMPVILDEVFAYYDNERLENILKYLNENYKENQIIIFTCSNREKEILDKNEIKYNYINL